jgi:hypothetical protein
VNAHTDLEARGGELPAVEPLTPVQSRLVLAGAHIRSESPDRTDFLHTVMCQVGLPRRKTEARSFERHNGHISILLEAGKLFNGKDFVEAPLPYGTTPRLVMVRVSSEAIRTQRRSIEIGESMRQFLTTLGVPTTGGKRGGYTMFKRQMEALAACRLTLGMYAEGRVVTKKADPIERFEAWLQQDGTQRTLWPGVLELSKDFFDTLQHHAVPLDYRALAALKHSALALDVYTWLAHRVCRVRRPGGEKLSWENLRDQFGQEYHDPKNFKREFRSILHQVETVYPYAKIDEVPGGLILHESRPPLSPTMVAMGQIAHQPVDKSTE